MTLHRATLFLIARQLIGRQLNAATVTGRLHDPANVRQTFSKCIQNTRANAGRLLEVCWTFARSCKHFINRVQFHRATLHRASSRPRVQRRN